MEGIISLSSATGMMTMVVAEEGVISIIGRINMKDDRTGITIQALTTGLHSTEIKIEHMMEGEEVEDGEDEEEMKVGEEEEGEDGEGVEEMKAGEDGEEDKEKIEEEVMEGGEVVGEVEKEDMKEEIGEATVIMTHTHQVWQRTPPRT